MSLGEVPPTTSPVASSTSQTQNWLLPLTSSRADCQRYPGPHQVELQLMPAGRGAAYYSQVLRPSGRNPAGQSWPTTEQVEAQLQVLRLKGEYPRRAANPNVARYVQSRVLKISKSKECEVCRCSTLIQQDLGRRLRGFHGRRPEGDNRCHHCKSPPNCARGRFRNHRGSRFGLFT